MEELGVGLIKGILERLGNIPVCVRGRPLGREQARTEESHFKSSSCLPVTQIQLWSTALVLAPVTPQDGPGAEQVQAGPLAAGVSKNNCDPGLGF